MRVEPEFCWIEITLYCNQKYMHCFMANDLNSKELEFEVIKKIVSELA